MQVSPSRSILEHDAHDGSPGAGWPLLITTTHVVGGDDAHTTTTIRQRLIHAYVAIGCVFFVWGGSEVMRLRAIIPSKQFDSIITLTAMSPPHGMMMQASTVPSSPDQHSMLPRQPFAFMPQDMPGMPRAGSLPPSPGMALVHMPHLPPPFSGGGRVPSGGPPSHHRTGGGGLKRGGSGSGHHAHHQHGGVHSGGGGYTSSAHHTAAAITTYEQQLANATDELRATSLEEQVGGDGGDGGDGGEGGGGVYDDGVLLLPFNTHADTHANTHVFIRTHRIAAAPLCRPPTSTISKRNSHHTLEQALLTPLVVKTHLQQ